MPLQTLDLSSPEHARWAASQSIGRGYTPVLGQDNCSFLPEAFRSVLFNMLQNPNITSSHLFRADILYDSEAEHDKEKGGGRQSDSQTSSYPGFEMEGSRTKEDVRHAPDFPGFRVTRTLIRRLVPRNPQLDKPLEQSCHFLVASDKAEMRERTLVVCIPHVDKEEEVPWYHPAVQALAYLYDWQGENGSKASKDPPESLDTTGKSQLSPPPPPPSTVAGKGKLSVFYQLFAGGQNPSPLPKRLQRMAFHLLSTMYKHGEGAAAGYTKKFHFDLLLPQARVQDTYSALKQKHARRLCDSWVEVTEPSKHVFEDLAIAAFLIELWRDMYRDPDGACHGLPAAPPGNGQLPEFPGFVDIGCGNGVLTEILLSEGFHGWGFDARKRKTWEVVSPLTKERLREMILIPQPLLSDEPVSLPAQGWVPTKAGEESSKGSVLGFARSAISSMFTATQNSSNTEPTGNLSTVGIDQSKWNNGLFPRGTFIISNHADELTAWTPLLAALSHSPFLAIPCCSHNLSGARFRAPSAYTGFTADAAAPQYFAREKMAAAKRKHIAIHIPTSEEISNLDDRGVSEQQPGEQSDAKAGAAPEKGDLKALSQASRAKQPSAYASLCDWVAFLADEIGFDVEKESLRIPSTRNLGIVCRRWADDNGNLLGSRRRHKSKHESDGEEDDDRDIEPERWDLLMKILQREKPDSKGWIERARKLMAGKDDGKTVHG